MSETINLLLTTLSVLYSIVRETVLEVAFLFETSGLTPNTAVAQVYEFEPAVELIGLLKIIGYIATPILIFLIVIVFRKFFKLAKSIKTATQPLTTEVAPVESSGGALGARWGEILNHMASTNEGEWKFAVIEADKLVDDILKSAGYRGETMGERLMSIDKSQLVTLDTLWDAHKIRNRLVHDTNYFLRYAEAKRAVQLYEDTLKELGAL
ncbi:MAG: hypothetical protein A3J46_04435 [Candidatus Yanofskybacteria bacterium RIFCSPHIGHO2_02_FULL_41_11]|uniref:DUF4145 domain-containing protein n=1 Tax=Candidatus Yanofskybacteria bacterium RIFCSPHIGHO2_02_FULL_41_11 TaxID=1802675 RepID=A0A1F8F848_9BACT|nr:MAG: hypothetical protein A3J46_04435 [Candidatus Yanofskybacteria bacterium RIFCSPHIGHO2_02_FULL_41_11]